MAELLELMDHEVVAAGEIWSELMVKYKDRPANWSNLQSLRNEATDKFRSVGLEVLVHTLDPNSPPTIEITGRLDDKPFDRERQSYEVNKGVADEHFNAQRKK